MEKWKKKKKILLTQEQSQILKQGKRFYIYNDMSPDEYHYYMFSNEH